MKLYQDPELAQMTFVGFSQYLTTQGVRPEAKSLDITLCFSVLISHVPLLSAISSKPFVRLRKVVNHGFLCIHFVSKSLVSLVYQFYTL